MLLLLFYNHCNPDETFLGSKPYLMGNDPAEVDCSMFGILAQFKWSMAKDFFPRKLIEG